MKTQSSSKATILTKELPRYSRHRALIQVTVTLQPSQIDCVGRLIDSGISHVRLNLSHYRPSERNLAEYPTIDDYNRPWENLVRRIWEERQQRGVHIGIMLDTAGPEFRIRSGQKAELKAGDLLMLVADHSRMNGNGSGPKKIYVDMSEEFVGFPQEAIGKFLRIKDGECQGIIQSVDGQILTVYLEQDLTIEGKNEKLNLPDIHFDSIPSVGPKDYAALSFFLQIPIEEGSSKLIPIDYVAQSFVRSASDINALVAALNTIHPKARRPLIIVKLETKDSIEESNLRAILKCKFTAAIMIARGDLANETARDQVPRLQRWIAELCRKHWKPVLVATQVYGSMENPAVQRPSRPEAEDLYIINDMAIDGVVLTAETVKRPDPERVVILILKQAAEDERDIERRRSYDDQRNQFREEFEKRYSELLDGYFNVSDGFPLREHKHFSTADMALAVVHRGNHRRAAGLFPFTVKGNSVRDMVHFLPYKPIFPFSQDDATISQLLLYRGVFPIRFRIDSPLADFDLADLKELIQSAMVKFSIGEPGDSAIGTMPHPLSADGGTDTLVWIRRRSDANSHLSIPKNPCVELGDLADNLTAFNIAVRNMSAGDEEQGRKCLRQLHQHIMEHEELKSLHWLLPAIESRL